MPHSHEKEIEAEKYNKEKNVLDANKIIKTFSMTGRELARVKEFGLPGRVRSKSLDSIEEQRRQTKGREITRDKGEENEEIRQSKAHITSVFNIASEFMKKHSPMKELKANEFFENVSQEKEVIKKPKSKVLSHILGCCKERLESMGFDENSEQQKSLKAAYKKACKIFEEIESKKKSRSAAGQRFRA